MKELLKKYDIPAPRYTSYPTVPYWCNSPTTEQWLTHLNQTLDQGKSSWSLYLHIPFCETLCTFCGCNTIITKDHSKELDYAKNIIREWNLYSSQVSSLHTRELKHIHLGGGSPTFLSPNALDFLLSPILDNTCKTSDFEASIEVDPRRATIEQLKVLRKHGFTRISLGVQDFNPEVQKLVNRSQPYDLTSKLTLNARNLGFTSINFDLIYGLPKQTASSIRDTVLKSIELRPDRIAFYSFALVPWIKPTHRIFKDDDLPKSAEKRELYEISRELFLNAGYIEVGMDHFALPGDTLTKSLNEKRLHRNFMGYTDQRTEVLLGLGVSSISETPHSFHQNEKIYPVYAEKLSMGKLPSLRGHVLTDEDKIFRDQILKLMTEHEVQFLDNKQKVAAELFLSEMITDELITISDDKLAMTKTGRPFLRNACLFFDQRLKNKLPGARIFSQSI